MIELVAVRIDHPRGGAPLVEGVSLKIDRGEVVLLGGAASAGSSRLCGTIAGDHPAGAGRVELFGRDLRRLRRSSLLRLRRRVGIVPQDLRLLDDATALANVLLPLDIDHVPRRDACVRAAEVLGRVGLAAETDVQVDRLSMAERQRVAIARALVRTPAVIVADEPTCHQDAEHARSIASVLASAGEAGACVLIASRDPALWSTAARRGWRTLALRDGRLTDAAAPLAIDVAREPSSQVVVDADIVDSEPIPNVIVFPASARGRR
jgi:ABC-type ATPase involved in cell division